MYNWKLVLVFIVIIKRKNLSFLTAVMFEKSQFDVYCITQYAIPRYDVIFRVWPRLAKILNALGNQDKANNMDSKYFEAFILFQLVSPDSLSYYVCSTHGKILLFVFIPKVVHDQIYIGVADTPNIMTFNVRHCTPARRILIQWLDFCNNSCEAKLFTIRLSYG